MDLAGGDPLEQGIFTDASRLAVKLERVTRRDRPLLRRSQTDDHDEEQSLHRSTELPHVARMPQLNPTCERVTTPPKELLQMRGITLALIGLAAMGAAPAEAQVRLNEAIQMLDAQTADEVRLGIEALGTNGSARVVAPLSARIRRGLPAELLDLAIETLGVVGHRDAGPVLFQLLTHRREQVRLAVVSAIVSCRPRGADGALVTALSDSDPRVRAAAALGLGQLGARDKVDHLFHAFERGVLESATAIGQLADGAGADRLLDHLGRVPFDAIAPAVNELIARSDVAERVKLEIIGRLAELATPEVRQYLQELVESLDDGPVRRSAEDAVARIAGGTQ